MIFPNRFRSQIAVALVLFAGTFFVWSRRALTPLQRYYFWIYLNCTVQGSDPALSSEVHWLYKTASQEKQELATDQDVVLSPSNQNDSPGLRLSLAAQKMGWAGLVRGPEEWIKIPRLQPFLQQQFYEGESLWRILLTPLLWSIAVLLCQVAGQDFLTARWAARRLNPYSILWAEPSPCLLRRWATAMRGLRFEAPKFIKSLLGKRTSKTVLKTQTVPSVESSGKPPLAVVPLFGAMPGMPKEKFVWHRKNEID